MGNILGYGGFNISMIVLKPTQLMFMIYMSIVMIHSDIYIYTEVS